ncbi:MAG: hypothetical protein ACI80V_000798 [Rhodothermales bacterium]|jgi:hypothetical protein
MLTPTRFLLLLAALGLAACSPRPEVSFRAGQLQIGIGSDGSLVDLTRPETGQNFLPPNVPPPLLSVRENGVLRPPSGAVWDETAGVLTLDFGEGLVADVRIEDKDTHATLELTSLSDTSRVELVVWGPYPTTLNELIGETIGVVQGDGFAVGLQALNIRTLGGYPWNENDAMPQLDIFESGDFTDLSEEGKRYVLYRVEAAKPDSFGSTLQAYARNRSRTRVIPNQGYDEYVAPAFNDGGVVGSKIALFGAASGDALSAIGAVELAEGLPHPMLDGVWAKESPRAAQAYVIMPFSEATMDEALDVVERAGMQILYHPDPFSSWGHFTLRSDDFPNGSAGLKAVVDRAAERGMRVGAHTLSNFTHPHDAYVSPVPDPRLARVGAAVLAGDVDSRQTEIQVSSPDVFRAGERSTLRTVVVGDELIQYSAVSAEEPWRLLDVTRGAFNTKPAGHESSSTIALLADHGYKVFLTNPELSVEMAGNIADVFNQTGLRHISFDGLEGNRSTGMGNYGEILFTQAWFDALTPENQQDLIVTASRTTHYFWHLYTRMNWGEPWYAGFRESQTEYRMKNQPYFKRNLMPAMLGWFSLRPETTVEDIEWMLARSAAYDAGYALSTSQKVLREHGRSGEMLDAMAVWERARLAGAFSVEQKRRMEDVSGEFHLEESGSGTWTLYPVASLKYSYTAKERQPGEPGNETFAFENAYDPQPLVVSITAVDGPVRNPVVGLDGVRELAFPVVLQEGQMLQYSGGSSATVYRSSWHFLREVPVQAADVVVRAGAHRLSVSADTGPGEAKVEVRLTGPGEIVQSK